MGHEVRFKAKGESENGKMSWPPKTWFIVCAMCWAWASRRLRRWGPWRICRSR